MIKLIRDWFHSLQTLPKDAIVIIVVGPTGSGRSTFINKAVGSKKCAVTSTDSSSETLSTLTPITTAFQHVSYQKDSRLFVFVDTPGLDLVDMQPSSFGEAAKLEPGRHAHGIIYLHRLTDPRATTVPKDYAPIFKRLCGEDWTKKFIVATTLYKGNDLENKQAMVKSSFWKDGVLEGALLDRFTETEADAWRIVNLALGK